MSSSSRALGATKYVLQAVVSQLQGPAAVEGENWTQNSQEHLWILARAVAGCSKMAVGPGARPNPQTVPQAATGERGTAIGAPGRPVAV